MRTGTRLALIVATAASMTAAFSLPAQASPINSPRISGPMTAECDGVGAVDIVSPPASENAQFTPGFVVGTRAVAVPYSFHFVVTAEGDPVPVNEFIAAKTAVPRNAVTCTLELGSQVIDGVTYTSTGTVVVAVHGQPQR